VWAVPSLGLKYYLWKTSINTGSFGGMHVPEVFLFLIVGVFYF
jgi:hypothetical protein